MFEFLQNVTATKFAKKKMNRESKERVPTKINGVAGNGLAETCVRSLGQRTGRDLFRAK